MSAHDYITHREHINSKAAQQWQSITNNRATICRTFVCTFAMCTYVYCGDEPDDEIKKLCNGDLQLLYALCQVYFV